MKEDGKQGVSTARVQLDWSRLLGFDQAPDADRDDESTLRRAGLARLGSRVSIKPGTKDPN